jgi:hypothetical protein
MSRTAKKTAMTTDVAVGAFGKTSNGHAVVAQIDLRVLDSVPFDGIVLDKRRKVLLVCQWAVKAAQSEVPIAFDR